MYVCVCIYVNINTHIVKHFHWLFILPVILFPQKCTWLNSSDPLSFHSNITFTRRPILIMRLEIVTASLYTLYFSLLSSLSNILLNLVIYSTYHLLFVPSLECKPCVGGNCLLFLFNVELQAQQYKCQALSRYSINRFYGIEWKEWMNIVCLPNSGCFRIKRLTYR